MSKKEILSFGRLLERSKCNIVNESNLSTSKAELLNSSIYYVKGLIENDKVNINKSQVNNFIESIDDYISAKHEIDNYITVMNSAIEYNKEVADKMLYTLSEKAIHKMDDKTLKYINEKIQNSKLDYKDKEEFKNQIIYERAADRIINNHNKLCKSSKLNTYISRNKCTNIYETVLEICDIIDKKTKVPTYAKYNIMIEEAYYLLLKEKIDFKEQDIVEAATDYILLKYANNELLDKMYNVIETNKCISENALAYIVGYINESEDFADSNDVRNVIKAFNKQEIKNEGLIKKAIYTIFTKSPASIIDETPNILSWIRTFCVTALATSIIGANVITVICTLLVDQFIKMDLTRKRVDKIINYFDKEKKKIEDKIGKAEGEKKSNLESYQNAFMKSYEKLTSYRDKLYTDEELDRRNELLNDNEDNDIGLNEFKVFKFQNLISLALDANKAIELQSRRFHNRLKLKKFAHKDEQDIIVKDKSLIKDIVSTGIGLTKKAIASMIGEDGKFSCTVGLFDIHECMNEGEVHEVLSNMCNSLNNYNTKCDNVIFTYHVYTNEAEIVLNSNQRIIFEEAEDNDEIYEECFAPIDLYHCEEIAKAATAMHILQENNPNDIIEEALFYQEELTQDIKDLLVDYAYVCGININDIKPIVESSDYATKQKAIENTTLSTIYLNKPDIMIMAEASFIVRNALNELNIGGKPIDGNTVVNTAKPEKAPKKMKAPKINLNSLKIAMQGVKEKVKELGQKEKEISRTIDINFNNISKGIERALVSDRREAIIKGSIIPSFSKCIKTAIVVGGGFLISPIVTVIGTMGALAVSKNLTKKERILLLDEIDIELKVVEKELSKITDEDGKINKEKYRSLLTYQKNLLREKQRIRYNLTLSGKPIPETDSKD